MTFEGLCRIQPALRQLERDALAAHKSPGIIRDILILLGALLIVGSVATQWPWIAGVLSGVLLIGFGLWWSWAEARAAIAKERRDDRGGIPPQILGVNRP